MLEVKNLLDKDALFYFKDGLKDWARVELDRHNVQTLNDVIVATEKLVDYSTQKKKKPRPHRSGGDKLGQKKEHDRKDRKKGKPFNDERYKGPKGESSEPPKPCFICDGSHWTRECPNRKGR